jgi:hypothetical protein
LAEKKRGKIFETNKLAKQVSIAVYIFWNLTPNIYKLIAGNITMEMSDCSKTTVWANVSFLCYNKIKWCIQTLAIYYM